MFCDPVCRQYLGFDASTSRLGKCTTYKFSYPTLFGVIRTGVDRTASVSTAVRPKRPKKRFY
ncbi:hypothetical protein halTADL_0276 [Halohasta litchfieldiae]|jgi:hypothetical protein|nr:hypothetical protein halTADL_0276 [Halohasta litchfieldiae]